MLHPTTTTASRHGDASRLRLQIPLGQPGITGDLPATLLERAHRNYTACRPWLNHSVVAFLLLGLFTTACQGLLRPGSPPVMARVYADVNQHMPRAYWDYDSVNISWGVLENYEVVRKIGTDRSPMAPLLLCDVRLTVCTQAEENTRKFLKASTWSTIRIASSKC